MKDHEYRGGDPDSNAAHHRKPQRMTTKQKVWTWIGTGIGMGFCAVLGIGGTQLYNNQTVHGAEPDLGAYVKKDELHDRLYEVRVEFTEEVKDLRVDMKELRKGQEEMQRTLTAIQIDAARAARIHSETARNP